MFVCPQCAQSYPESGFCGSDGTKLDAAGDDALIGAMVGVYQIAALVGVGGWGRVYKGVHPEIGSRVAIKVLSHDCSSKPELIQRFFNEARAVNLIRHEGIVNIIDLAQLPDGRPYIVMEFLDGVSLAKYIANQGMLGISETCRICAEVLDALSVAHQKGIIHRDLKPDNLFLSPEGRAKILDFGIAKLREEDAGDRAQTRAGSILGTPHFMSPEQALARPVEARSDIYSVGVILFQCLTGRLPFEENSVLELARAHAERPPVSPKAFRPEIPEALDALVLRALAKAPADRWPDAATLSLALKKLGAKHPGERTRTLASEPAPVATLGAGTSSVAIETRSYEPETPRATPSSSGAKRGILIALASLLLVGLGSGITLLVTKSGAVDAERDNVNGKSGTTSEAAEETAPEKVGSQPEPPPTNSEPPPTDKDRATPAPQAQKKFPISGGLTPEAAELVQLGKAIEGVANKNETRYYKFDVVAGQSETFTIYSELTQKSMGGSNMVVTLLAGDGEKLAGEMTATYATALTPEFDKDEFSVTFKESASIQLVVTCGCALTGVHYRIMTAER